MTVGAGTARARWKLRDPAARQNGISRFPPIVATVLAARGVTTRDQAELFYKPHLGREHDPLELPGMRDAVARIRRAIHDGELIALFGDFDVDGVTSVALLQLALGALGARTTTYIPDRFTEGYGLNTRAIDRLGARGATLLITADCGVSSVAEVAHANADGIDVVILDHHTVPEELPPALAVVNPKRLDSPYPFTELAAVGVAFRFLQVLYEASGRDFRDDDYLDLVALGTVVDVAPLADENRRIVTEGLARMRRGLRPGLEALAAVSGVAPARFGGETLGFALGPRLNAAGRLQHADLALDLMLAESYLTARPLAEQLDALNRQRQLQTEDACTLAEEQLGTSDEPLIMVGSEEFHAGIVGIVASRLAERRHRPAIVFQRGPLSSRASARSIPAFDIVRAIRKEAALLERHGGHRGAAGFTVPNENLDLLRERLINTAAEMLDANDLQPLFEIDAEVRLAELDGLEVKGLMRFEPCGEGNRKPLLLARRVRLLDSRAIGSDQSHLRLRVKDGLATWPAVAFRQAEAELADEMDIVFSLQREWKSDRVELEIIDMAPSATGHPLEV